MAQLKDFRGIEGSNFFEQDRGLQILLSDLLPEASREAVFESLERCGALAAGRWNELARDNSRQENLPRLVKYDRVGNRTEQVDFGPLARQLRREVAEFGVLNNVSGELHKFAITYFLGHNGEGSLTCGLSCTDGLARAIEAVGSPFLRSHYLPRVLSAETPMAGAQFVTERAGGSDVGAIEAVAEPQDNGTWRIIGEKWYCSNPDEYYLVAARPVGAPSGTRGVAVFLVPRVLPDGSLNAISFRRLKDKLGTRSLPTAEIDFEGAVGYAIGEVADGFKTLMNYVINASRLHNAVNACGFMHRAFLEARNYARQRDAFGGSIINYPLVQETLLDLLESLTRLRLLTFRLIALVDANGIAPADAGQAMWQRFLTNLAKYRTAARLTERMHDAIMVFGANGIIEDFSIMPRLLRDAMIIETWEGTHNTLCLQIVRDASRSDLLPRWRSEVTAALEAWPASFLPATRRRVESEFARTLQIIEGAQAGGQAGMQTHARRLVDRLGALLELAWSGEFAARHAQEDATPAILTAFGAGRLFPAEDEFAEAGLAAALANAPALIDETPIHTDLAGL